MATGGQNVVRRTYKAGTPAYGVGAGNSTMVIDETADIKEAAMNTMLSKTSTSVLVVQLMVTLSFKKAF